MTAGFLSVFVDNSRGDLKYSITGLKSSKLRSGLLIRGVPLS